jgi:hypothetical protein
VQTIRVETPSAKHDAIAGSGLLESPGGRKVRVIGKAPKLESMLRRVLRKEMRVVS